MYIIIIKKVTQDDTSTSYEKTVGIYEQRIEELDIEAVIRAANKIV